MSYLLFIWIMLYLLFELCIIIYLNYALFVPSLYAVGDIPIVLENKREK